MYRASFSLPAYCCVAVATAMLGQSNVWGQAEQSPVLPSTDMTETIPSDVTNSDDVALPDIDGKLRFSFRGASWREVLDWIAEAGDLSLYVDDVPTGSFTYSDSQYFTVDDAVTRLNLFLLPRGYTLVRKGQMLSVINLGDPRGLQQLNAMARVVSPQELAPLNDHEVVKCFVKLGDIVATEAINEMEPLSLMTTPVVLPRSNQLIITDTAKNLRSALQILESMKEPLGEEADIRRFDLKHVDAATVLLVAGTHLGIPENEMSGIDITITTDTTGRRLFAVGSEDKLKRLDSLIQVVDVPEKAEDTPIEKTLVSHSVSGDNLQVVYDVLQTILADKSLRLSMQESSNSIVALADADTHQLIRDTIQELQAPSIEFSVVELNSIDPYFAVSLVAEMFGVSEEDDRDENEDRVPPPKVDADPGNRRLFVRGTAEQIRQIEQLIQRLDSRKSSGTDLRFIPLTGPKRENLLQTAKKSWGGENCLQILPGEEAVQQQFIERSLHNEEEQGGKDTQNVVPTNSSQEDLPRQPISPMHSDEQSDNSFVSLPEGGDTINTSATVKNVNAPIRSQLVPNGILLQSDDIEALDRFEEHLRMLSAQDKNAISPTVIYYLKYVSADEAVKMLADLLDGGNALNDSPADTLVRGSVGSLGSYYGSLLFDRDGVTTVTAGTATIVSDARLNRLIVQGTREDIATIESYMKIIDKDSSITDIETAGRSRVIELKHARANEVAEMIREAFPDRVDMTAQRNAQARQAPPAQSGDNDERRDDEQRGFQEKPTRGSKPTMAVAVHEASNSLVITAPDALFSEVEQLVASVDQRSERAVRVITATNGINLEMIQQVLAEQAGNAPRPSSSSRTRSTSSSSSSRSSRGR